MIFFEKYVKKNLVKLVNKKLYKIALYHDYYLMTNITLMIDDHKWFCPNVLVTNKFIYVVYDQFYPTSVSGSVSDASWLVVGDKNNPKILVPNPIKKAAMSAIAFNKYLTNESKDLNIVIPISVVNNGIKLPESLKDSDSRFHITLLKNLEDTISHFEEQANVNDLNQKDLETAIRFCKTLNGGMPPKE